MNVYSKLTDMFKHNIKGTYILRSIFLLLTLMTFGAGNALAQDDLSGIYYIASGGKGEANSGSYNYNSSTPSNNFYLCPTEGWCFYQATDDFSSSDTGMPFLTTYKCRAGGYDATKAIWVIEKAPNSDYYYIKQYSTGKYLVANGVIRTTKDGWDRMRIHLEAIVDPVAAGNSVLFNINDYTKDGKTYKVIRPMGIDEPAAGYHKDHDKHKWLTVNYGNYNYLIGRAGKTGGPTGYENTSGIIGLWEQSDANAPFYLEDARVACPTFSMNAAGDVTITVPDGTTVHYTLDGTDPTAESDTYTAVIPAASIPAGQTVKAIAVPNPPTDKLPSAVATLPLITYHIVNKSDAIAVSSSAIRQLAGTSLSGYASIPAEIQSPYISDETITFYTMEGVFDANKLDNEHKITATPDGNANIYVTYTTDQLGGKFLHLQMARPLNLKYENPTDTWKYLWDDGGTVKYDESAEASITTNNHLWYIGGRDVPDPYDVLVKNSSKTTNLIYASSSFTLGAGGESYVLTRDTYVDGDHHDITLKNFTSGESFTVRVNTVEIPTSYYLIDKTGRQIFGPKVSTSATMEIPSEWRSPLATYHYWRNTSFEETAGVYTLLDEQTELSGLAELGAGEHIFITYDVKNDIDLDGRNLLGVADKVGKSYRLQFAGGESFNQEDGLDGVSESPTKAIYPYSNGDASLYVYGEAQWTTQLASGASTRTRWLWYLEPAKGVLDPYHVRVSSYQTQTSYKVSDSETRNFHSYLRTYRPASDYAGVVTGVTNNNPLAHGGAASDPAVTNLPEGSEYMLLGTDLTSLKLVTVDAINDGSTAERRTVNSFEQYWKNNPTVQGELTTKVTQVGRNVTLTADQKSQLPTGWHAYNAWANSAPWVHNNDGGGGTAHTTSKKFLNEEHVYQTINMGETFRFVETEIKPMLILLDQHGWEIVRLPLPSGPTDPKRKDIYADLHKYSSPMVERYHFWKTGSKIPGYHKYTVSDYATNADGSEEYTADELGRADITNPLTPPNLPDYGTQALVGGKERDWYVTYDVKDEYAGKYAGAATEEATSAYPYLIKQNGVYAQYSGSGTSISTTDTEPADIKNVPVEMQWYLRPNFDIDEEMGYLYEGEAGAQEGAKSKAETELDYFDHEREDAVPTWSNGFDPYNVQIKSAVPETDRYFTANTTGSAVTSCWEGSSSSVSLQNVGVKQSGVIGLDQTKMKITNATFMVVDDGNGNMRLMPRFDNTKVMQNFTALAAQAAAADKGDEGTGIQTLYLTPVPKVVNKSSDIKAMGGDYILSYPFTADETVGTKTAPFRGTIEGQIGESFSVDAPFIAYAKDAVIKNVIIESADISGGNADGHSGAIVATASGETRIYNCGVNGGSISGTAYTGGIVGHLQDYSRVINCYSYATIEGGTDVGGIVGHNDYQSKANDIRTMVMNCVFYGDITGGTTPSPVYGGEIINNLNSGGLNTFNYYAYDELKTPTIANDKYNCALAVQEKYLKRFEFYRLLLNSNKKLAAIYSTSSRETVHPDDMMKWVLETADKSNGSPKPYPVLKKRGYYPSIINYDTRDLANYTEESRNQGLKTGELSVTISGVGDNAPAGASITDGSLTLIRTDKDYDRFNYNYDKVQLPYYNDVGTGNYTGGKVVTGWKITGMTGGTTGTYREADEFGGYNFADRQCTAKDIYNTNNTIKRVFSQGAYFDVPYGVTAINIEPYWGNAAYVADQYYDVVYNTGYTREEVKQLGTQVSNDTKFNNQKVYSSISAALANLSGSTVYDNAVVLVGNLHQSDVPSGEDKAFTVMSVDEDHDNEPDYSMIYHHTGRTKISPIRFDFINIPGTAQAQKPKDGSNVRNFTIFKTRGWFETTNTCLVYSNQVEYENQDGVTKMSNSPLILQGGDFEQFVSTQSKSVSGNTNYIHVGGNVHIQSFGLGTHGDGSQSTPHKPVSVTGGAYDEFYLTGTYNQDAAITDDDAECYISGGYFKEAAGACQEQIGKSGGTNKGNVHWQIYNADMDAFYGGGINAARPVQGNVTVDIFNSHVTLYCGGPKFGDMQPGKKVTTNAEGCVFGKYFGGGYGGTSYSRKKYYDEQNTNWSSWSTQYTNDRGKYFDGITTNAVQAKYGKKGVGVATDFDYEFFVWSTGGTGGRFYVKFASFSLATCNDVESNLKGCTVEQDFYGGGSYGEVKGKATSVIDDCTVLGNVFGGGYSAQLPKINVRNEVFIKVPNFNKYSGMFEPAEVSTSMTECDWEMASEVGITLRNNQSGSHLTGDAPYYVCTDVDLHNLGKVGETDLTVKGNTSVAGNVFGGGDESAISASATATGNTKVTIEKNDNNETPTISYVYGGGNTADVDGSTEVDMTNGTVSQDIYGGGKGQTTVVGGNVEVNIGPKGNAEKPLSVHNVYGGSALGAVNATKNPSTGDLSLTDGKTTTVNIYGGTVTGSVFGGGLGQVAAAAVAADPEHGIEAQEAKEAIVAKNFGATTVNMEGGAVKKAVYGGSNVNGVLQQDATVTLIGGTVGDSENQNRDVVFGGGKGAPTLVNGNVTVNIGREKTGEEPEHVGTATIYGHVYGGGELGNVNASKPAEELVFDPTKKTLVNLFKGTVNGYAYGGGLGSAEKAAYVGGDVIVTLDGAKVKQVFGANNINGTPKGHVKVWVKRTVDSPKPTVDGESRPIGREGRTTYDVEAVYGGGNKADYVPTKATGTPAEQEEAFAEVIIEGCELTSIDKVYGGGNAAAVPATDVTVKGSYIINTLYGGGNGAGEGNLGANVGYRSYSSLTPTEEEKTSKQYGTGKAETKLLGGYINEVYGGSNTRGDVRDGTDVRTKGKTEVVTDCCETLNVGNVYGAGSHADVEGDVNIVLECMPRDFVDAVYGGAEEATIDGNVTLTVTSGKFGRVFGGNNLGGSINGSITVVVNEDGCEPLIIGELYGGGNQAPYSVFGCTKDGETGKWTANKTGTTYYDSDTQDDRDNISVYVIACTSVGKVFGGGYGATADVLGNTYVYINMLKGKVNSTLQENIGKVGQVFGGGNQGAVKGNARMDIGTALASEPNGVNIISGTDYLNPESNTDIEITAGIYGGGNMADVDGNTTLNIGTKNLPLGVNIAGDIFGGGYGATTHVTGDVIVNIGKRTNTAEEGQPASYDYEGYANITGDVYGGSAQGKVNSHLEESVETATEGKTTHVNFYGGSITGNIYGGGLGEDNEGTENDHAADVYGPVTVTLEKGSSTNTTVNNVFGCNNVLGTPKNTVTVDINGGTVNNSVYGGGNQAAYTPTESTSNYPAVNIINGTVNENVFGGGLGLTAVVTANPHITIGDNVEGHVVAIKKSVYGGGELAGVTGNTDIVLNSGTIGTEGEGGAIYGNIYGGGFGNTESTTAGLVSGNTNMTINGGAVLHNLYGGGAYGSVGTYTYNSETHETTCAEGTGTANITVAGGTIGTNGHENGMVFGASRGDVAAPDGVHDRLAWVNNTNVIIGTSGEGHGTDAPEPQIKGSVYGGGENGHTYHDTHVTINSGRVGITDINIDGGAAYAYRGNVYGGGCGTDKYVDTGDGNKEKYNPKSGIVNGTTHVVINGGHVVRNLYGAGAMGSAVTGTNVTINGGTIGAEGSGGGYVYAAARGDEALTDANQAYVGNTSLTIAGGTIWQSAFGGGQSGIVKGNVAVNVSGGVVKNDVYGGGALANTNTDNWNTLGSATTYVVVTGLATETYRVKEVVIGASVAGLYTYDSGSGTYDAAAGTAQEGVVYYERLSGAPVAGYYTKSGDVYTKITNSTTTADAGTTYYKKAVVGDWATGKNDPSTGTTYKTTVNLTGGLVGNVYGGGLGSSAVAANVYGDVTVTVNQGVTDPAKGVAFIQLMENPNIGGTVIPTPVSGRVFGGNNHNGTPTGEVTVHVYSTRQLDNDYNIIPGHGSSDRKYSYEIQSVYGGGNQADYMPADGKKCHVIIDGCNDTSIEKVYGGGNSAVVPETDVLINGAYDIGYAFGGGNGDKPIKKDDGIWYENEGAIVIGLASIVCQGGKIGQVFGGGDAKGSCGNTNAVTKQLLGGCPLHITRLYGAGNKGDVSSVNIVLAACSESAIDYVHGGSYNAHVHGDVHLTITSGILKNVYGGNDARGGIEGNITVDIEETNGCNPIIIQNLIGGGNEAPYPGTKTNNEGEEVPIGTHGKITVNVKSATRIDNIYGGSFMAETDADTEVNINMIKGCKAGLPVTIPQEFSYIPNISGKSAPVDGFIACTIDDAIGTIGNVYGGGNMGLVKGKATVNIGASDDVKIMARVTEEGSDKGKILDENDDPLDIEDGKNLTPDIHIKYTSKTPLGVHITGDVFGGGKEAGVTGNAEVYICANKTGEGTYDPVAEGSAKVTVENGSVYGGGSAADVLGNTNVTMAGGYVFDGVYGGGLMGSVGTAADGEGNVIYHTGTEAHAGCIGKIVNYKANTGKSTVVVTGGQVGPAETALADGGMENTGRHFIKAGDDTAPVDYGFVFGAGRGEVEDPATDKDADFRTFVKETDVTIGGTAFIMASVYGGGENGRVANDTHVTIEGDCQIGCGEGKVTGAGTAENPYVAHPYDWADEDPAKYAECASWPYDDPYVPYDPYAAPGDEEDAKKGSDGHTYYGNVFGGGSGYFPYKKADGSHEWLRSAGQVYGNTKIDITGGHILTSVYGGNEMTDVGTYTRVDGNIVHAEGTGKCTINMVGGTLGVPRTDERMKDHPVTCYLFGAGKGDQRTHFNTWTNVQETEVNVSGTARIFGSVFGGGEDGHVLGNAKVNIGGNIDLNGDGDKTDEGEIFPAPCGLKIGTTGTSYVDGNIFGGGRGFSGLALTAGSTGGNTEVNITDGTMLGSIYGGGRLASVGIDFTPADDPSYGQLVDDKEGNPITHGHITVNISGGTIGNDAVGAQYGGNVFGAGMGRNTKLNGDFNELWPKIATSKTTTVNISGGTIKKNVYGGAEYGIVRNQAEVTISGSADIRGSVYGGGKGSDDYQHKTTIEVGGYANLYYSFTPMLWNGAVSGNTIVNVEGGTIGQNVYGGGELASVGLIDFVSDKDGNFTNMPEHTILTEEFGLSWPYKFTYHAAAPNDDAVGGKTIGGKTTVNITGGHIGSTTWDDGTGYVFGGSKGKVEFGITSISDHRYTEAFCANVKETEVNINFATPSGKNRENIGAEANCIMGAVYGGGEDGHVYDDAEVNITGGLIGLSVYGAGKGISTYKGYLRDGSTSDPDDYKNTTDDLYSWTAGKVYGNTKVTMTNGHVLNNVYGGGYLGSVGKGNYSGGADDYFPAGYGETITGNLWDNVSDNSKAFLSSGKATVEIKGGTIGTLNGTYGTVGGDPSKATPTGIVFGGSRGQAAQDIMFDPRYEYAPNFYLGYVNETEVTIGTESSGGPRIFSQVFGGGRDGHVRNSAHVIINDGIIGQTYAESESAANPDYQRYHRGNVYGSGSGLGLWDGVNHGMSSGSVTNKTTVDINGGTIYNNVYGGGALSSVGPPRIDMEKDYASASISQCVVNINGGTIGQTADYESHQYGGCVYGASRGNDFEAGESPDNYATVLWTQVNINDGSIAGNVYGGAKGGIVWKDTKVNLLGGIIAHDAYGGGQGTQDTNPIEANVGGNTTVKLNDNNEGGTAIGSKKGCIVQRIFGCNDLNGTPKGHVKVHVFATQNKNKSNIITKDAPYDDATNKTNSEYDTYLRELAVTYGVTIPSGYTDIINDDDWSDEEGSTEQEKKDNLQKKKDRAFDQLRGLISDKKYDVLAVYGGGNLAQYKPYGPKADDTEADYKASEEKTEVIIDGCHLTSIRQVYGGGNAAPTSSTSVAIYGTYEIDEVFGGGNGKDDYEIDGTYYENPGANVGYYNYTHYVKSGDAGYDSGTHGSGTLGDPYKAIENDNAATKIQRQAYYLYGSGVATTDIIGGRIHYVYGGSNEKGNISKMALSIYETSTECPVVLDKTYGAGKNAPIDGNVQVSMECVNYTARQFGGSTAADVNSDITLYITNGHFGEVFGGNDRSGKINGSITVRVKEEGCKPIVIGELYGGGYLAGYSVYGYNDDDSPRTKSQFETAYAAAIAGCTTEEEKTAALVAAGLYGLPYRDPQVEVISASKIGTIYGGGYGASAKMIGNPSVNVNMEQGRVPAKYANEKPDDFTEGDHIDVPSDDKGHTYSYHVDSHLAGEDAILRIGSIDDIYGGGNLADVLGDTHVEIGTNEHLTDLGEKETITPARNAATITGNVYGGGKGADDNYLCDAAMVGEAEGEYGSTSVIIGNGTVGTLEGEEGAQSLKAGTGNVYGGGEIGRVQNSTAVTIGVTPVEGATDYNAKFTPIIRGNVFGAGKGVDTHGFSALVMGNSTVTIQGAAKVERSVYGGGEKATVGRYNLEGGRPTTPISGGVCTVTVKDDAEIGPDNMIMTRSGGPDDTGYIFGAGKGATPGNYTFVGDDKPRQMTGSGWTTIDTEADYLAFIETLGLASETHVTVSGNAFIKGSVYGGAENGYVQTNTNVTIAGGQIGNGYVQRSDDGDMLAEPYSLNRRYTDAEWEAGHLIKDGETNYTSSLPECASWPYGQTVVYEGKDYTVYAPHDIFAVPGTEMYPDGKPTNGGRQEASDGHTFYGNVFGGGSGYYPYAAGKWHFAAGSVGGNTTINITGGHILTNIYGGNEMTNVAGTATINFGGTATLGVPRTLGQIDKHPVTCYLFGAGKGDTRVFFNKQTNVKDAIVNITGGTIYGSVFGGGEDGHVLGNVTMNIQNTVDNTDPENPVITATPKIGTWGTSYVDGNVFGGGRGFTGDAYTAGNVGGAVTMNISGGEMLGSIYGGGRLGSVGYGLYMENEAGYGEMRDDDKMDNGTTAPEGMFPKGRGHVEITISGGTIGNDDEFKNVTVDGAYADLDAAEAALATWQAANRVPKTTYETIDNGDGTYTNRLLHTKGGNVYAGGMGRREKLDGSPNNYKNINWLHLGNVKSTKLTITGGTIKSNVYGGGEFGAVRGNHMVSSEALSTEINISGGTVGTEIVGAEDQVMYTFGSVFGGGTGTTVDIRTLSPVALADTLAAYVADSTKVTLTDDAVVRASVFGGGELSAVGGSTHVNVSGNTQIGRNEVWPKNSEKHGYVKFGGWRMGNVYGGGRGIDTVAVAGVVKGNTNVNISGGNIYHNVYGGGALASVGTFFVSGAKPADGGTPQGPMPSGVPYWMMGPDGPTGADPAGSKTPKPTNKGIATVTITGGTIGISGRDNGLVFGSSRGDISAPAGTPKMDQYDRVAWVRGTVVNIGTEGSATTLNTPLIKGSVYGGGENGHNYQNANVNVYSGTIGIADKIPGTETPDPWWDFGDDARNEEYRSYRGNVYGAGSGSDTYTGADGKEYHNARAGMVGGSTVVNIAGGHIGRSVYGAGAMASVGNVTNAKDTTDVRSGIPGAGTAKHSDPTNSFALSWPYKYEFAPNTGKATVNVTGGHIGTLDTDGGDVYGSARGVAGDRYLMAHCAYVKETVVNINYTSPYVLGDNDTEETIQNDFTKQCITGSVHGSGENGFVYDDAVVTLNEGLIGHSLYGAGKGNGTYTKTLNKLPGSGGGTYDAKIYSLIAGKVMGNTFVTMNGGRVMRNVYGGGNMGSVGKGNYSGGADDYYPTGYGETITGNLWTSAFNPDEAISESNKPDDAYYFLSSGKTTVKVLGGVVGYIDATDPSKSMKNQLPYGNVIGGSAGEAAPNIAEYPRYEYSPAFFSGYVNETDVTIGGGYRCTTACTIGGKDYKVDDSVTAAEYNAFTSGQSNWEAIDAPTILASVYGGSQDGHVRRDSKVTVNNGEIGLPYNDENQAILGSLQLGDGSLNPQWLHRGNVYGGGSGITKYKYDFDHDGITSEDLNGDGIIEDSEIDTGTYHDETVKDEDYSSSSGSVTRFAEVNVLGGIIHRNVYGGGSLGSVGAPKIDQEYDPYKPGQADIPDKPVNGPGRQSLNLLNIGGQIGTIISSRSQYGGDVFGAGRGNPSLNVEEFGTSIWTRVNILNGATIFGNVFGGGDAGAVKKDAEVMIGE